MIAIVIAEGIAIILLGVLVVGLLRGHAQVLKTLHDAGLLDEEVSGVGAQPQPVPFGVQAGTSLPRDNATDGFDITGPTPAGSEANVQVVGAEHDTLVAFLSSGCHSCQHFWETFQNGVSLPKHARLAVVTKGDGEESVSALRSLTPRGVPVVMSSKVWEQYSIPMAPYFIYIDGASGKVRGEGAATTWEQVDNLMRQGLADQDAKVVGGSGTGDGDFREARADRELMAAGIFPGDESLYGQTLPTPDDEVHDHGAHKHAGRHDRTPSHKH